MSQTSYSNEMGTGIAGQIADSSPHHIHSYNNPVDAIPFGRAVVKVTADDNGIELPTSGSGFVGVSVRDLTNVTGQYEAKDSVSVMRQGVICVELDQDVTPDDPVFFRHAGGDLGVFRMDADTANAAALTTASYLTSGVSGGTAWVEIK